MFKGLVGIVQKILGNQDIGPVPITISIKPEIKEEDIEQLRKELQERGISAGRFVNIPAANYRVLACSAPKGVYEEVFKAKVKTRRPFNDKSYTPEYEDLRDRVIPEDLKSRISSVSVSPKFYAADE